MSRDVDLEQLPAISIVVAGDAQSEQPGAGPAANGIRFVASVVDKIAASPRYHPTTLVLVTHLTSGGFYDHVPPPPAAPIALDTRRGAAVAYGPRVPLLALGRFALVNHVSHEPLELSSVTKFLEWNWLGGQTGQLGHRDTIVSNIGSLLDGAQTGTPVP
jgi:phospholipase C